MRLRLKVALCVLLVIFAAMSLISVLSGLGVLPTAAPASADGAYLLREWEGYIAVFCPPGAETPTTITDIRVRSLPLSDRLSLTGGVSAADYREVVRLLEDYGS